MPEKPLKKIVALTVIVILVFILRKSFSIRNIGYDQIPETFGILDERTNVWHGLSLRRSGVPAAWSNLTAYKLGSGGEVDGLNLKFSQDYHPTLANFSTYPKPIRVVLEFDYGKGTRHTPFVQPYLDHPPFGALVLSAFVPDSIRTFTDLKPADFRKVTLWLGILSAILIFLLGWQLYGNPWIGLLAATIYSSVPTFILLSRYALLENVLTPLILTVINLLVLSQKIKENKVINLKATLFLAGIVSGLAALTKMTGWSTLVLGIVLLLFWKIRKREILFFALPSILIGSLYFVWGLYLAPQLFINIFRYQGLDRGFIGSINLLVTMLGVGILNFPLDGWWLGGFLSFILVPFKKEHAPIFFSALIMLITALLLGGANYPWYFIPLIPFMCITTAFFIWQMVKSPETFSVIIFFLIFFSSSFYWGYGVYKASLESTNYQQPFGLYRIFLIAFFALAFLIKPLISRSVIFKYVWFLICLIIIYKLWQWNNRSILFLLSHWGKLPSLYTPGTF